MLRVTIGLKYKLYSTNEYVPIARELKHGGTHSACWSHGGGRVVAGLTVLVSIPGPCKFI